MAVAVKSYNVSSFFAVIDLVDSLKIFLPVMKVQEMGDFKLQEEDDNEETNILAYVSYVEGLMNNLYKTGIISVSSQNINSLCGWVAFKLLSFFLEDVKLSDNKLSNGLIYFEPICDTLVFISKRAKEYVTIASMLTQCNAKLAIRKRNIRNNFANEDFVQKMNFLNKHNELEFCLKSLKELVILKTILFQEGRQLSDFKNHFLFGVRQFMGSDISLSGSSYDDGSSGGSVDTSRD